MVQTVADVMTPAPTTIDVSDSVQVAARAMAAEDVGALVVRSDARIVGIVTDRDLAVTRDPSSALADISEAEPNR